MVKLGTKVIYKLNDRIYIVTHYDKKEIMNGHYLDMIKIMSLEGERINGWQSLNDFNILKQELEPLTVKQFLEERKK